MNQQAEAPFLFGVIGKPGGITPVARVYVHPQGTVEVTGAALEPALARRLASALSAAAEFADRLLPPPRVLAKAEFHHVAGKLIVAIAQGDRLAWCFTDDGGHTCVMPTESGMIWLDGQLTGVGGTTQGRQLKAVLNLMDLSLSAIEDDLRADLLRRMANGTPKPPPCRRCGAPAQTANDFCGPICARLFEVAPK